MRIGIAFDLAPTDPALQSEGPDDRFEEFDKPETVEAIAEVIRAEGHEVVLLGDGREFLTRVLADPPDFVFNIAEGEGVGRCREARVPAVLEMLGIPYSGSDPLTLSACLDKSFTRRLFWSADRNDDGFNYLVPEWSKLPTEIETGVTTLENLFLQSDILLSKGLRSEPRVLIFKPAFEGSSKGIRGDCLARSAKEAVTIYRGLVRDYNQPILAEEFIEGDEVTVGIIGTHLGTHRFRGRDGLTPLGVMRVLPRDRSTPFVYSLEVKRDWRNLVDYEAPADYPAHVLDRIVSSAEGAFAGLGCRDFARIDFRVRDGVPYFIEANPLPGLAPGTSDLVILAQGHGIEYPDLIRKILHASLTRVGLK